jgi:hypothetical protein
MMHLPELNPQRMVDELTELQALTGNAQGAQRLAWTETWLSCRLALRWTRLATFGPRCRALRPRPC